jgi:hypothetical protein
MCLSVYQNEQILSTDHAFARGIVWHTGSCLGSPLTQTGRRVAAYYGFVSGDTGPDGTPLNHFRPDAPMNRAEVAKLIAPAREVVGTPAER